MHPSARTRTDPHCTASDLGVCSKALADAVLTLPASVKALTLSRPFACRQSGSEARTAHT